MKKFVDALIKSALLFMATAVLFELFLHKEWLTMAIIVAVSWAVGEIAQLWYRRYTITKVAFIQTVLVFAVFVVVAFTTGVLKNFTMWWRYTEVATATFVVATLASPMWQKRK